MTVELSFRNAFTEVYEILNYLDENDYNKIPKEILDVIEKNRNLDYIYYIDEKKDFLEQEMLEETKAILFNIFRDYLATDIQKEKIFKIQKNERLRLEEEKRNKYDVNIFDNKTKIKNEKEIVEQISLVKTEKWYVKFFNLIKNMFI